MADVITRFKLETSQYDSKLRDASKALAEIGKEAMDAGKDFDKFTKESIESAKALGSIATTATTTKGKVQELVGAYNDVAKAYNKLTEDQKQSDFGKAMAGSLQELQGRIKEAKSELYGLGDSGKNTGGIMSQLADKFTINIDAIKLFSAGLAAAKGALDVAKDAFFASESTVDEWGRTMQSAESLYTGFLTALNTGDISGYISRMDDIVSAARKAYDEMDRLGTLKTIQGPATSRQEAENSRLRMILQTGRWIEPFDSTGNSVMKTGDQLNKEQLRAVEQQLQNGMNNIVKLTQNELNQTGKAIEAYYDKLAKENGMTLDEFKKGVSTMDEFEKRVAGANEYAKWQLENSYVDQSTGRLIEPRSGNPYAQYRGWDVFTVDKMGAGSYNGLVDLIRQQQSQVSQLYSTIGQTYRTINRAEGTTVRSIMNGGSGGTGSTGGNGTTSKETYIPAIGSIDEMKVKVKELQDEFNKTAKQGIRGQLLVAIDEAQKKLDFMSGKGLIPVSRYSGTLSDKLGLGFDTAKVLKKIEGAEVEDNNRATDTTIQAIKENMNNVRDITSSVSGILNGIQNMGIEIPEEISRAFGILQTMSSVLTAILTITTLIKGEQEIQTGASIFKAIFPFAAGGVVRAAGGYEVPGNYGYDAVPALLSSGELVLNKSQQGVLAASLQDSAAGRSQNLLAKVKGTDLIVMLDRTGRMTGKGELAFWKD